MENKNLMILGVILLGLVVIAGVFVLVGGNGNVEEIKKEQQQKITEIKKKIGVEEKPEIKEVKNEKTGKIEKIVDNGTILSVTYEEGKIPTYNAVDAKVDEDIDAITFSLDADYLNRGFDQKMSAWLTMSTPEYYNKTKNFVLYLGISATPLSYDDYVKYIQIAKKDLEDRTKKQCEIYKKEFGEDYYNVCINQTKKLMKFLDLFYNIDKETYEKMAKLSKDPIEIYYVYRNGTEEIYLSKNLYATLDAAIYTLKDVVVDFINISKEVAKKNPNDYNKLNIVMAALLNKSDKYLNEFYNKAYEFYNKIDKPYVLIKRKVVNKDFFDILFEKALTSEKEMNETVKEQVDKIFKEMTTGENLEKLKELEKALKENASIEIKQVKFDVAIKKKLNLNDFLPKEYVNYEDLKLININEILSDIQSKWIEASKDLYANDTEELQYNIDQINKLFTMLKAGISTIKENSLIDLMYQLRSMFMNYYGGYHNYYYTPYENYNNVQPPSYNYNYPNTYETEIRPISA